MKIAFPHGKLRSPRPGARQLMDVQCILPCCKRILVVVGGWATTKLELELGSWNAARLWVTVQYWRKCLLLRLFWTRKAFEFRFSSGTGHLLPTLRWYQVLPSDSLYFDMCRQGRLEDFRNALVRNKVSPFAVSGKNATFLHFAAEESRSQICKLLIQLNVDPTFKDNWGFEALDRIRCYSSCRISTQWQDTVRTLTLREIESPSKVIPSAWYKGTLATMTMTSSVCCN